MESRRGTVRAGPVRRTLHDLAPATLAAGGLAVAVALVVGGTTANIAGPGASPRATVHPAPAAGPPELSIRSAPARPSPTQLAEAPAAAPAPSAEALTIAGKAGEAPVDISASSDPVEAALMSVTVAGTDVLGAAVVPATEVVTTLSSVAPRPPSPPATKGNGPKAKAPGTRLHGAASSTVGSDARAASGVVAKSDDTPGNGDKTDRGAGAGRSAEARGRAPGQSRGQDD